MGKSESQATIALEKDVFEVGETIRLTIICDNDRCKKPVKGFKIKLLRNIQCTSNDEHGNPKYANHQKYIAVEKVYETVDPRQNISLQATLTIPEIDDYEPDTFTEMPNSF